MTDDLNILILSCGTRNKIVEYFKKELKDIGEVMVTDSSKLAPALYEADKHYIVPKINEEGYIETILSICKKHKIKAVLSLIDPELNLLAEHKEDFLAVGTVPIVSESEVINLCFDKYKMYEYCVEHNIPTVKSYIDKEKFFNDIEKGKVNYPVFVKPVQGSASININKVSSKEEIDLLFNEFDNLMIQEYMNGVEYGVDVYIDMISEEPVSIFIKEKIKMRAGETDKSVSIKSEKIFDLIQEFLKKIKFKGIIDIDVFKEDNEYYISEVNPRFGGGYPHAYECGENVAKMIINNINQEVNNMEIGNYDENVYMLKYNEMTVKKII